MENNYKAAKRILFLVLIGWMLILTKFILFKESVNYYKHYFSAQSFRDHATKEALKYANTVPFNTITDTFTSHNKSMAYKVLNLGGNILGFIPLGLIFPILFMALRSFFKTIIAVLFVSLIFELIQRYTGLGIFDVDDLILNLTGGIAGYILYQVIRPVLKSQSKIGKFE